MRSLVRLGAGCLAAAWCVGCASSSEQSAGGITVVASERLEAFEGFVRIRPDSVARLYRIFTRDKFYETYSSEIRRTALLIDSLNLAVPPEQTIDTLSIEFASEQFGVAVRTGHCIYLSSGFYFVYNDPSVIRSIMFHEYGHIHYEILSSGEQGIIARIWNALRRGALLYVFVDGEYSGNAWFGGHPDESPEELFASAFNLFHNRPEELRVRLRYVPSEYHGLIDSLKRDVGAEDLVLFE